MAFDPSSLNLNDPILQMLLRLVSQQQSNTNPNIAPNSQGVFTNTQPSGLEPSIDYSLDPATGDYSGGGRGYVGSASTAPIPQGPPSPLMPGQTQTMARSPNPWAGMTEDELALNQARNFAYNQGVSSGLTDKEAFTLAEQGAQKNALYNQKNLYTQALQDIAGGKRGSEEDQRKSQESIHEQDRKSREAIANANLRFQTRKMNVQWSQDALREIAVFARTLTEDPRTRAKRFPTDEELQQYQDRLQEIPGALEPLSDSPIQVPTDTNSPLAPSEQSAAPAAQSNFGQMGEVQKQGAANQQKTGKSNQPAANPVITQSIINTFTREVRTKGMAAAVQNFMASPNVPQELKDALLKQLNGNK